MWDILAKDSLGLVLLLDNSRPDPLADMALYLDGFASLVSRTEVVIGVTRADSESIPTIDDYIDQLLQRSHQIPPIMEVDIRRQEDVLLLLDALITCLEYKAADEDAA